MAKKSLIAGEYIIEIADNGHVDVVRVFRNAMVVMEEIAKSKNFEVNPKWNTQDLGRHLVKEFGDGKSAQFKDITINKFPDGKIEIYQECKNVIDALRTIAQQLEFPYDEGWNTQTFGSKLSDYLIEHKEEADKILQTKNARRKKENVAESLNISTSFDISETNKSNNTTDMAKFNLTAGKAVAELKKEFNEAFGSKLKVYNKNKIADDAATLGELGLKADTEFECRASRTAGSFIAAFAELGLKVKIYTQDEWVAVLSGLTLEATGKVKKNATKADMEGMEGYQREEKLVEEAEEDEVGAEEKMHTYHLRIESETLWRFDTVNLENADEDDIYEGFNDNEKWAEIVGETRCLYTQKEDLEAANDGDESLQEMFDDEDAVSRLVDMIGDNYVDDNCYYPDAEEDFSIVVLNEDDEELETIDGADIPSFRCEQGCQASLDDYDESEEGHAVISRYLEQTCNPEKREHAFIPADEESWFWLNVQKCCVADSPVYELVIPGEFDASKLSVKKVLIEEAICGMMSIECVTEILYDGEPLDIYEEATADEDECTNFFIKMDEDGKFPEKVYDFTNNEES